MSNEEAVKIIQTELECIKRNDGTDCDRNCAKCDLVMEDTDIKEALGMAIEALQRETSGDAISRRGAIDICNNVIDLWQGQLGEGALVAIKNAINNLPSVHPIIRCKDCRWWKDQSRSNAWLPCRVLVTPDDFYCGRAERRTDDH